MREFESHRRLFESRELTRVCGFRSFYRQRHYYPLCHPYQCSTVPQRRVGYPARRSISSWLRCLSDASGAYRVLLLVCVSGPFRKIRLFLRFVKSLPCIGLRQIPKHISPKFAPKLLTNLFRELQFASSDHSYGVQNFDHTDNRHAARPHSPLHLQISGRYVVCPTQDTTLLPRHGCHDRGRTRRTSPQLHHANGDKQCRLSPILSQQKNCTD